MTNNIQDILIGINDLISKKTFLDKKFNTNNHQIEKDDYVIKFRSPNNFSDYSMFNLIKLSGPIFKTLIQIVYNSEKCELFHSGLYGYDLKTFEIPFSFKDIEEESKKDDIELILTYGRVFDALIDSYDSLMKSLDISISILDENIKKGGE